MAIDRSSDFRVERDHRDDLRVSSQATSAAAGRRCSYHMSPPPRATCIRLGAMPRATPGSALHSACLVLAVHFAQLAPRQNAPMCEAVPCSLPAGEHGS